MGPPATTSEDVANPRPQPFSVLLIDDSDEDRYSLRRLLRQSKAGAEFEIREAGTGARGLALLRERLPDCLLLDYSLGDTDGLSVLAEINAGRDPESDPVCPTLILTGAGTAAQVAARAFKGGVQDYLVKESLTEEGILRAIRSAVEKMQLRRELRLSEQRFRLSLENMTEGFAIYASVRDPADQSIQDFRCEYINEAGCRHSGLAVADLAGSRLGAGLVPWERLRPLFREFVQVVETGVSLEKTLSAYDPTAGGGQGKSLGEAFDIRVWKMNDGFAVTWRDVTAEKRAEGALRASEARLSLGLKVASLALAEVDYGTGLNYLAEDAARLFGLGDKAVAVPRAAVHATFHPDDRAELTRRIAGSLDPQGPGWFSMEHRVVWPGGEVRWLRVRKQVFFEGDGDARRPARAMLAALDITDEKMAEVRLRRAEDRFAFAVESSESGVFEMDCETGQKYYAPRTFDLLGLPMPESPNLIRDGISFAPAEAREFWQLVHADDRSHVEDALRDAYDPESGAKGLYQAEYRVHLASGADRWIASKGRVTFDDTGRHPVRLAGLLQNVTARKREQQTMQQLAAVVEHSEDFIGIATIDGMTQFVNPAGRRLAGITDAEAVTRIRLTDYFFPEDVPAALALVETALTAGHASAELRLCHFVTGEPITALWNVMAIREAATGQPYALAAITRDIGAQKRLEAERAALAARREQIAEAVQRSLLLAPLPDAYPGLRVHTFYKSAWDEALIGGDFFDVFAVSADVVALVVGDATGKGVEAATYTAEVKFALRAYLREHQGDLAASFTLLNRFVIENENLDAAHTLSSCIALAAVLFNTRTGAISCCCAGAEPPLILRAGTGEVEEVGACGMLLGVYTGAEYVPVSDVLGVGDRIALTTDGITEMRRPATPGTDGRMHYGEFFGLDGLARALRAEAADPNRDLAEVDDAVVAQALAWAGGRQHDDICLLLAQRR